ncbi:MAG: PrsW family intramembrane metalloprotease [Treponema sp.]|jgi:RsiW-degrading membrane proteinase PrsW (M82 family)|nr:PrsW family intramembrane metalloprotease [Treponema sp.]
MNGLWVLILLILISALPVLLVYIWFRLSKFSISLPWFLLSLLGGAAALTVAALIQSLVPGSDKTTLWVVLYTIFIRIALFEEAGRFIVLLFIFGFIRRLKKENVLLTSAYCAATGLLTGLGFAVIETASYGAADMSIALLRAFTAAPIHGACGSRVGLAALKCTRAPVRCAAWFFSAVIIHGAYNFLLVSPGTSRILPILIAFAMLVSPVRIIRNGLNESLHLEGRNIL